MILVWLITWALAGMPNIQGWWLVLLVVAAVVSVGVRVRL